MFMAYLLFVLNVFVGIAITAFTEVGDDETRPWFRVLILLCSPYAVYRYFMLLKSRQ